jgi:1,4-dihydroxy-2-naphthoate octaprenyltransferase/chlorophyll synthase
MLVPAALGQGIGVAATGELSWSAFLLGLAFTVFDLLFIVFLNDVGDERVDRIKREMFPDGCSPKTIPDRVLDARSLVTAGIAAGLIAMGLAWAGEVWLGRPGLGLAGIGCLLIFVGYTFPPIQLNYRGGGELFEMLGVGVALPWFHAYLQSGEVWSTGMWLLPGFSLLALASAVASGLADEQSDAAGGKTTYATSHGNVAARRAVENLVMAAMVVWALGIRLLPALLPAWGAFVILAVIIFYWRKMVSVSAQATTNAFAAQKRYKQHLHRAIWHATTLLALLLSLRGLLGRGQ